MKRFLLFLSIFVLFSVTYAQQITLFGDTGSLKFELYPLKVNRFDFSSVKTLTQEQNLRVCEALDNSLFVMFGAYIKAPFLSLLFENPSISTSLRGVLDRGGLIFFNPVDYATISSLPNGMRQFFKSVGASVPETKNYKDVSDTKSEKQTEGSISDKAPAMFLTPNAPGTFRSIRHFVDISGTSWKVLVQDKQNRILAIYNDKASKGTIVFSFLFNVVRTTESPFVENMLVGLYGPLKRQTARTSALAKMQTVPNQQGGVLDLRKKQKIKLKEYRTGAAPRFPTEVTLHCENNILFAHFDCKGGANPPVAAFTSRDSGIWNDDCVELIIRSSDKSDAIFYHFILNSSNALYDDKNGNESWNSRDIKTTTSLLKDGWYADLMIPMSELEIGKHFMMTVAREETSAKEISSWKIARSNFTVPDAMVWASIAPDEFVAPVSKGKGGEFVIQQVPTFTRVYADSEPPVGSVNTKNISFLLPQGDRELAQIVLYNYTEENMEFRLEPEYRTDPDFAQVASMFKFYDLLNWRAVTGQVFAEIMAETNSAGVISVPAGETKTFVLAAQADGIAPGKYSWGFELVPVNFLADNRKIQVKAEVLPLKLGPDMPEIYTFGPYSFSYARGNATPFRQILKEAHVNMTMGPSVPFANAISVGKDGRPRLSGKDESYLGNEAEFTAMGLGWYYGYGSVMDFNDATKRLKLDGYSLLEPKGVRLFEAFVARWTAVLKKAKIDFNRFYVPLRDEPRTENIPELLVAGRILKKYGIRTCCTMATWSTLDDLRRLSPAISLWIPWEPRITTRSTAADELRIYRESGHPITPYLCSMSGSFEPYQNYYRFRGIRTHIFGAYGFSVWAANSWRGNPYRHADDKDIKGGFMIHHGANKPVGTLRLEAFREAVEDLFYLHKAAASSNPEAQKLASKDSLEKILKEDSPAATQQWRDNLVRALSK